MVLCCLPDVVALEVEGEAQTSATCNPLDLVNFLKQDLPAMNLLCERAGMFEDRAFNRTRALFEYFGLPFEG